MANRRTYTDDQLRAAVASATCWADVMEMLGKKRSARQVDVKVVAARLGLENTHFSYARSQVPVARPLAIFSRTADLSGCRSGLSFAARWFLDRGYVASVPLEPAPYDLIAESDDGLKRVQVKTTRSREGNGRYRVRLKRTMYDPAAEANAHGRYRPRAYSPDEVDLFFIVTSDGSLYLIPISLVAGLMHLVLDEKYAACRV